MDDLISEFLVETNESLEALDLDFVELEQDPGNTAIIGNIFRVMHTIKGTCGFLGLSRLEKVAHAAENVMDKLRDQVFEADADVISLILEANDRIKALIEVLEETEAEPEGSDQELIDKLNSCAENNGVVAGGGSAPIENGLSEKKDQPAAGTSDLDEEIDFTPVVADYAADENEPEATGTSDLDEEIDFTPVVADYATPGGEVEETQSVKISEEAKKEAVSTGLDVASKEDGADKKKATVNQSIRVNLDILEDLMQMVGELVLTRNQLLQLMRNNTDGNNSGDLATPLQRLNHITTELQEGVMKTRMQPIGNAWAKFPRLVRDLAHDLGKKIELKMIGADTDLDRQMLEAIKDPLTHMVRNSADHGIESVENRIAAGKPETGTVTLSAYHEGGHIIIKIADDGKGLDIERIKAKAVENNLVTPEELETLSEKQIYQFVFKPGFSTAAEVTAVSGRGVGMDVVVSNIEKTGGHVEINSWPGRGSEFLIRLPLTLAIMPVLIVQSGEEIFAIPQIRVSEIVRIDKDDQEDGNDIEIINNSPVLRLRGRLLPLISLSRTLNISRQKLHDNDNEDVDRKKEEAIEPFIVVCEVGSQSFGIMVDKVFHTEEIVVKPNSSLIKDLEVYSGCTILGDGTVIMILDPSGIIRTGGIAGISEDQQSDKDSSIQDGSMESFLVFNAWNKTPRAIPLELVSRLEEIDAAKIEWSGGSRVIQYRGGLMRLIIMDDAVDFPEEGIVEVIVFTDGDRAMGIVVEEIVDIERHSMDIKSVSSHEGILGSLIINEVATDLIDVSHYFAKVFTGWLSHKDASDSFGKEETDIAARILLLDDSTFFRKFMEPVLVVAGYDVVSVGAGQQALDILNDADEHFDLIITDIDMPEMNGIEFAAKCREIHKLSHTPIIALSSHEQEDLGDDISSLGFTSFVTKSDRDKLVAVVSEILAKHTSDEAA